ncbi:MAG: hypothetical protein F6K65_39245, partial [Moorea sp. SIO3C2]|nr:hypothetical protein [Moorena sp. SIO3C2]
MSEHPRIGRISRRRLFFLLATAAVASASGIVFGSTIRFQIASLGQSTRLFNPDQDFPPLAEWPPDIPESDESIYLHWNDEALPARTLIPVEPGPSSF